AAIAGRGSVRPPPRLSGAASGRRAAAGRAAVRPARGGDPGAPAPPHGPHEERVVAERRHDVPRLAWLAARGVVRGRGQPGDRDRHLHPGRRGV
ncbi:MAG: hypothetical protein AVDCRST_MAG88-1879, partial [uncultured Thermomicrobiales bacterium]